MGSKISIKKKVAIIAPTGMLGSAVYRALQNKHNLTLIYKDEKKLSLLFSKYGTSFNNKIKLDFQNGESKESTAIGIAENGGLLISSGETIVSADLTHLRAIQ